MWKKGQTERRIDKVKLLIDILVPNFQSSYEPSRDIAVAETVMSCRGSFGAKQHQSQVIVSPI